MNGQRLTKLQQTYLTRRDMLATIEDDQNRSGELGPEDLAALELAREDLEKARKVMEENAAYNYLMSEAAELNPRADRDQLQSIVRGMLKDPVTVARAVSASGLYTLLETA